MKRFRVLLPTVEDIKEFVFLVNKFPYEIDFVSGNYRVDAKSIMGIFSLQFNGPLTCEVQQDDCQDLLNAVAHYITFE